MKASFLEAEVNDLGFVFQTARLQRGSPWDKLPNPVDQFAEELMSMFSPDIPVRAQDLTVQNSGNGKGITFEGYTPSDSIFSMDIKGSTYNFNFDPNEGLTFTGPGGEPTPVSGTASPTTSSGGGGIRGRVVSGTGSDYIVAIYPNGPDSASVNVPVMQLQINPDETIPADTWVAVFRDAGGYWMQVPVWLV